MKIRFHTISDILRPVLVASLLLLMTRLSAQPAPQWKTFRDKDDLAGWIYGQIQWVARAPVQRVELLPRTVRTAWRQPRTNEEIQAWLDLLINEGYTFLISGDIVHSTDSYTAAFEWARQHADLVDDTQVLDNILKPLGNNYTRLGDNEQALYFHRKALAVATALDDNTARAGTYSNLANTAGNMGQSAQSLEYCRQGLQLVQGFSPLRGLLLSEQADAFRQLGQDRQAGESIETSIAILEKATAGPEIKKSDPAGPAYWLLTAYQQAGDIYTTDAAKALASYKKALALQSLLTRRDGPIHPREKAKLFQRVGELYYRTGQTALAIHWLDRCLAFLIPGKIIDSLKPSDLFAENTLADLLFTRARLSDGQGRTDEALRLYELSFSADRELRRELITGTSKERSVAYSRQRYETAIHTAWQAWDSTKRPLYRQTMLDFMESSKAQLLLEEVLRQSRPPGSGHDSLGDRIRLLERALIYYKKEALQQTVKNDSLQHRIETQEKEITWELAALHKKRDARVIPPAGSLSDTPTPQYPAPPENIFPDDQVRARSWFAGASTLYTVESGQNGILFADKQDLSGGWQDSIRNFEHDWFEMGAAKMLNHPEEYYRQAYEIYQLLFGHHPPEKDKRYILLPDAALNGLPVDALLTSPVYTATPGNWPFLLRTTAISYAYSLRTLQEQTAATGNSQGISGFFLADNSRHMPVLQSIRNEQKEIAAILKKGDWYLDDQSTTGTFRQALQRSAIVHISSHAFSGKDSTALPRIELYDAPFYVFELKDLERHPSLVVLDACRTGDGRMVTGEGIQSLARAFTAGGTNGVVAGWWNVNDQAAAQLMQHFYRCLTSDPNAATCLRRSKLGWLNDPAVAYQQKLPYYWAALNYSGNPIPITTAGLANTPTGKIPGWIWIVIPFLALAAWKIRSSVR